VCARAIASGLYAGTGRRSGGAATRRREPGGFPFRLPSQMALPRVLVLAYWFLRLVADVAELADAPDSKFQFLRFQRVSTRHTNDVKIIDFIGLKSLFASLSILSRD